MDVDPSLYTRLSDECRHRVLLGLRHGLNISVRLYAGIQLQDVPCVPSTSLLHLLRERAILAGSHLPLE